MNAETKGQHRESEGRAMEDNTRKDRSICCGQEAPRADSVAACPPSGLSCRSTLLETQQVKAAARGGGEGDDELAVGEDGAVGHVVHWTGGERLPVSLSTKPVAVLVQASAT